MVEPRRILEGPDVKLIVAIIKGFRKKPTWDAIVAKARKKGLPFKLRAIQRQPLVKAAYESKVADIRSCREDRAARHSEGGRPCSRADTKDLLSEYEARITDLTNQNAQLAEQLHWLRQRCRRENIEVAEINRPLAFPRVREQS